MHILQDRKISHAAARLLLVLLEIRSPKGIVRDTHEEIANLCSMSRSAVKRLMKHLEYVGYVRRIYEPCTVMRMRGASNAYVVYETRC